MIYKVLLLLQKNHLHKSAYMAALCSILFSLPYSASQAKKPVQTVPQAVLQKTDFVEKKMIPLNEQIASFSEGVGAIRLNGVWGFVDAQGKMVIAPQFGRVSRFGDGLAAAMAPGGSAMGYIDSKGYWVILPGFFAAGAFFQGWAAVQDNRASPRYFIDSKGQQALRLAAEASYGIQNGSKENGILIIQKKQFQRIDSSGKVLNTFAYDYAGQQVVAYKADLAAENRIVACVKTPDGKPLCGCVDYSGQWVIAPEFENIGRFYAGYAVAGKEGKKGIIDRSGNWVVAADYANILVDNEGTYKLFTHTAEEKENADLKGWFDDSGKFITAPATPEVRAPQKLSEELRFISTPDGLNDLVDQSGRSLIQGIWERDMGKDVARRFSIELPLPTEDLKSTSSSNDKQKIRGVFLHLSVQPGTRLSTQASLSSSSFSTPQQIYALFLPGQQRILNKGWSEKYDESNGIVRLTQGFSRSMSNFESNGPSIPDLLYFADTGEYLVDHQAVFLSYFDGRVGFAYFTTGQDGTEHDIGEYRLIDRQGRMVFQRRTFSEIKRFYSGVAWAQDSQTGLWGAIDNFGRVIVPFEYSDFSSFHGNYAFVEKQGAEWIVDRQGRTYDWPQRTILPRFVTPDMGVMTFRDAHDERKIGLIRGNGVQVLPAQYAEITQLAPGLLKVISDTNGQHREGLIDPSGRTVLPVQYASVKPLNEVATFFVVGKEDEPDFYAIADAQGKLLTDFDVADVVINPSGGWLLHGQQVQRLLLPQGKLVTLPALMGHKENHAVSVLDDDSIMVMLADHAALADAQGEQVSGWYDKLDYLGQGIWAGWNALKGEHYVILQKDGKERFILGANMYPWAVVSDPANNKQNPALVVRQGTERGPQSERLVLVDAQTGQALQPLPGLQADLGMERSTSRTSSFSNGLIPVGSREYPKEKINGYVDMAGLWRIPLRGYLPQSAFHDQRAVVMASADPMRMGVIDMQGKWMVPVAYQAIMPYSEERTWAQTPEGSIRLLDAQGQILGQSSTRCGQDVWLNASGKLLWPEKLLVECLH